MLTVKLQGHNVVEYGFARAILHLAGFGARREADDLVVYDHRSTGSLYCSPESPIERVDSLVVDEGFQSRVLHADGTVGENYPWEELVDAQELWCCVAKKLVGHVGQTNKIGRGSASRELHAQALIALTGRVFDQISFV
jgi:hypothetical protein